MIRRHAEQLARWLHWLFEASLLVKGTLASAEFAAGLGLLLTPNALIVRLVAFLTRHELAQDPADAMAQWFQHVAASFPIQTQNFYAWYLLSHGGLKLVMVLLLARRILWAYPFAMAVLAGFVVYQLHHWTINPSPVLLVLSGFDLVMIALVWREWRGLAPRPAHP